MITDIFRLFINFFMTGLFSVGGGLATLPFLYDMSDRTGWFTHEELSNMLAVSESTPGAIGANMASYTGFHVASVPGAIAANIGLAMPSVIIILIIARALAVYRDNPFVESAFHGLRPASLGLIAAAAVSVMQISLLRSDLFGTGTLTELFQVKAIVLAVILFFLTRKFEKVHPAFFLAGSAVIGIIFSFAD